MHKNTTMQMPQRLDALVAATGALIPVGLVVGNIGFEALVAATGLFWIVRCVSVKENPAPNLIRHPLMLPWMIWYGCIILSLIINGPGSKGWAHDVSFLRYPLFTLAMIDTSRRQPVVRYCLYGLAAGVILAAVNMLCAYLIGFDLLGKPLMRYTKKLKEASRIAGLAAYAAPFFITWALMDTRLTPKAKRIIAVIGFIAIAQTFQLHIRTAIIAMLCGIFPVFFYVVKKRFSLPAAIGASVFLIVCLAVFTHFRKMGNLDNLYYRFYIWKVSLAMWRGHPWVGVGVSAFQDAFTALSTSGTIAGSLAPSGRLFVGAWVTEATHAHNIFLMLMATTGLFGLTAFGWLFVNAVKMAFERLDGWRWGLITWPVVMLALGLTGFNIFHSWYQALAAFVLALIGIRPQPDELSKFYAE